MTATPEHGTTVIDWYTGNGYLHDFFEEVAREVGTMTFCPSSKRYTICFSPNEHWPKHVGEQARLASILLENPDEDGNYLIDGHFMQGCIRSINGEELYEWKDVKMGKHTTKQFVLKEEYASYI